MLFASAVVFASLQITTPAFQAGGGIPSKYTCDGEGRSPELQLSGVPSAAKSLAIVIDDPDVPRYLKEDGLFVHWIAWNLPVDQLKIGEGEARGGINESGNSGYIPPCPPNGEHRYVFKAFALDTRLTDSAISTPADFYRAIEGHVIDRAEVVGLYKRRFGPMDVLLLLGVGALIFVGYRFIRSRFKR